MSNVEDSRYYKKLEWHKTNLLIKVGELQSCIEEIEEKQMKLKADSEKKATK